MKKKKFHSEVKMFVKYLVKYYLLIVMVFNATFNNISAISLKYYGINIETSELTLPRYNWNIVESGVKHHKPNLNLT